MADFSTIRECIEICRKANVTLMIWGHAGLGKSSLVQQTCTDNNWGHINMRLSQMEASDLRGLPDKMDGRTVYLPPSDMPTGGMEWKELMKRVEEAKTSFEQNTIAERSQSLLDNGILFLDEINRAADDVLQATFELVLDRKIGQYVLPNGWSIVCAGNFNDGVYQTNGFTDAAFLDRFCHVTLDGGKNTLEEWINYMSERHGSDATEVVEFVTQNLTHLDGQREGSHGWSNQPSRRSWEAAVRVLKVCREDNYSERARLTALGGLVGTQLAMSFGRYNCPVKPRDLINNGVKKMSGKLKDLTRNQLIGLMWGMVSYCKQEINENENYANTCIDFSEWMVHNSTEKDLVVAFLRALVSEQKSSDTLKNAAVFNPKVAALLSKAGKFKQNNDFIAKLNEREDLHQVIRDVSWGN